MRISIVQSPLHWENPEQNLSMFSQKLTPLQDKTDLVLLPEMFSTGYSMNVNVLAESMDGSTMQWFRDTARQLNAAVAGSFICSDAGHNYNRMVFMRPDETFDTYDKRHSFSPAGEDQYFTNSKKRLILNWMGWRVCPMICYDLRFPVWSRNTGENADSVYDLLLYVANWPVKRVHHWNTLLQARAIENQAYVAGVNRTGTDDNGYEYTGSSAVVDYSGKTLLQLADTVETTQTIEISLEDMRAYRQQLPFLKDADRFSIVEAI